MKFYDHVTIEMKPIWQNFSVTLSDSLHFLGFYNYSKLFFEFLCVNLLGVTIQD